MGFDDRFWSPPIKLDEGRAPDQLYRLVCRILLSNADVGDVGEAGA